MTSLVPSPGSLSAWAFFGGLSGLSAVLPNPRRTIVLKTSDWLDSFPSLTVDQGDVLTFDLVRLLGTGETIASIESFALTVQRPDGATDTNLAGRMAGIASISGTTVSQRFDNFQPDVPWIKYLVTADVFTSMGNPLSVSGYLSIWQRPN
jgi:hypothetical protein